MDGALQKEKGRKFVWVMEKPCHDSTINGWMNGEFEKNRSDVSATIQ